VKSQQLLTPGKIFEDDILAGPECTNHPAEEVPEPYDHAQNLTETLSIELGAKSLILRVYDVLMNDRTGSSVYYSAPGMIQFSSLIVTGTVMLTLFSSTESQLPDGP